MSNKFKDIDNADLAMFVVLILGIFCLFTLADPTTIISSIVSGVFGLATGNRVASKETKKPTKEPEE